MRSAQPVSLVELFSVPGAGKSTLVDAVSRERPLMTREAVSASWQKLPRTSKLAHVVGAFLDPRVSWAAIATAFNQRLSTPESLSRLVKLVARSRWLASQGGQVVLDQGLLQDLWSIHYASGRTVAPVLNGNW